jgi:hypothetical protein
LAPPPPVIFTYCFLGRCGFIRDFAGKACKTTVATLAFPCVHFRWPTDDRRKSIEARLKELRFILPQDWLVWVRWPGHGDFASWAPLPATPHHPLPLNGAGMRMPERVWWASFSHDGQSIYTCGADPHIYIWDGNTYELRDRIKTELDVLLDVAGGIWVWPVPTRNP